MSEKIKISVIVPSYKPKNYLWECLDSICNQSLQKSEFEIILVLNGCCEPYNSKIKEYISKHRDINWNYIQTNQGGVSNARNIALDCAKGEFVAFVDDDDFISNMYLLELLNKADSNTVSLCYPLSFDDGETNFHEYHITNDYNHNYNKNNCSLNDAKKFFSGPVYKLIHKSMILDRRFDEKFVNGEDSIFMFLISDRIRNVTFSSRNAVYYRRIRKDGALLRKKTLLYIINNQTRMICSYTCIFFKHPLKYNLKFYCTRILAAVNGAIEQLIL